MTTPQRPGTAPEHLRYTQDTHIDLTRVWDLQQPVREPDMPTLTTRAACRFLSSDPGFMAAGFPHPHRSITDEVIRWHLQETTRKLRRQVRSALLRANPAEAPTTLLDDYTDAVTTSARRAEYIVCIPLLRTSRNHGCDHDVLSALIASLTLGMVQSDIHTYSEYIQRVSEGLRDVMTERGEYIC